MVLMNLFSGQEQRCRHREQIVDTAEEGDGSTETYILPYLKQIANENFLYNTGSSTWCSVPI